MRLLTFDRIDLGMPATIRLALAAAAVSTSAAVIELVKPAYVDAPTASAGVETAITGCVLLAAGLLAARFKHSRRLHDLLLLAALAAVAVTDLAFSAVPALGGSSKAAPGTGAQLAMQALVAVAFIAAAFAPRKTVSGGVGRSIAVAGIAGIGVALVAGLLESVVGPGSVGGQVGASQPAATHPHAVVIAIAIGASVAFVVAGIKFVLRAARGDENAGLLAVASFLLAAAKVQLVAMPIVAADWLTPDDGLRLAAYAVLVAAALRAYMAMRQEGAQAALTAERQRIARDLHDGLAQDLALISLHAQSLHAEPGTEHPLAVAARHALAVSRGAIGDLSASRAPTMGGALCDVADELARRFQVDVRVEIEPDCSRARTGEYDSRQREHVVRIAREAIVNAARHGDAQRIDVVLERQGCALRLRVSDDGCGIPEALPQSMHGFGLPTMRARAQSLGGRLTARPRCHGGTEVELLVP